MPNPIPWPSPDGPQHMLTITLGLTIDGTEHAIPCSQVKRVSLDLRSWGFQAEVEFWTSPHRLDDELFDAFAAPTLIEAALSVTNSQLPSDADCDPVEVKGLVTHKACTELTAGAMVSGHPVMHRRYMVRFADAAQVLWPQHFPTELHVDESLKDVIDAQLGDKITMTYDWADEMDATRPLIFLPLGAPGNEASFYDFIAWYARTRCGVFSYSAAEDSYSLEATKSEDGSATPLQAPEVGSVRLEFPETERASAAVLNASADLASTTDATPANEEAATGIRRDWLVRTAIQADVDARATAEANRLTAREHEVVVTFARYPSVALLPGALVDFTDTAFEATYAASNEYRVRDLHLRIASPDQDPTPEDAEMAPFLTQVVTRLELKAEAWVPLPEFRTPRWPAYVEGKIVSEEGGDDEETWQVYTDDETSLDRYQVSVPLFEDKLVFAPFEPMGVPGHLFFPAYKDELVLLEFELFSVTIDRFLDWRAGGRLPNDGQGNHILVGKKDTSKTSISHTYVDSKPVLLVTRLEESDTQIIELKDGTITISTKEEG